MSLRIKFKEGDTHKILKHNKKTSLFWYMFVCFLNDRELERSQEICKEWASKVAFPVNRYSLKLSQEKKECNKICS